MTFDRGSRDETTIRRLLLFTFHAQFVGLWSTGRSFLIPVKEAPGATATAQTVVNSSGERIIYIPFKDLDGAFENPDSNVILPYAEYKAMLDAWRKRNEAAAAPDAVITAADYKVTIDGDLARIFSQFQSQRLRKTMGAVADSIWDSRCWESDRRCPAARNRRRPL